MTTTGQEIYMADKVRKVDGLDYRYRFERLLPWLKVRRARRRMESLRETVAPESSAREDNVGSARLYEDMGMRDEARAIHRESREARR